MNNRIAKTQRPNKTQRKVFRHSEMFWIIDFYYSLRIFFFATNLNKERKTSDSPIWQTVKEGGIKRLEYFAYRLLLVINSKVASMILQLSESLNTGCPYHKSSTWFERFIIHRLHPCRIVSTLAKRILLRGAKLGHDTRKWWLSSTPLPQGHLSDVKSAKPTLMIT